MIIRDEETQGPPSKVAVDFGHSGGENGERQSFQGGVDQGLVSGNFLPGPAFNELLHRMKMAGDNFGNEERGGNYDANANDAGISHYLSSSQTQVSPAELPEGFRTGRGSLSVVTLAYSPSESDSVFEMLKQAKQSVYYSSRASIFYLTRIFSLSGVRCLMAYNCHSSIDELSTFSDCSPLARLATIPSSLGGIF